MRWYPSKHTSAVAKNFATGLVTIVLARSAMAAEPAGYLIGQGQGLGRLRLEAPPKPAVPSLPTLPQTFIPEPQHTAEFLAQLKSTAMHGTNFTVKAETPDPVFVGTPVQQLQTPVTFPFNVGENPGQEGMLLNYFLSGAGGTNAAPKTSVQGISPTIPVILPVNGLFQQQTPVTGSSKATYELR